MKLPITDKLLLDMYKVLDVIEDKGRVLFHPARSMRDVAIMADDPIYQKYYKTLNRQKFNKLIYWLKKNNYIRSENLKHKKGIILTKQGINKAIRAELKDGVGDQPKRKDGKWIMVMFDLPKREVRKRNILRWILYNLKYKMLQKSVWVTQYDVHEKTEKLFQFHRLDNYVKIFLIEEIS